MKQLLKNVSMVAAVVALFALPAIAQDANLDYIGYAYETGGFPPAQVGDEFTLLALVDYASPIFDVDLGANELTFYAHGFMCDSVTDLGGGTLEMSYTGGALQVFRDVRMDADYGTYPPNATAPSTFSNGVLYFDSLNETFTMWTFADGTGYFEGTLMCMGGEVLGGPCGPCAYTWGGAFDLTTSAQIPDGYDLQIDGELLIDPAVPTESESWSSVKALYR